MATDILIVDDEADIRDIVSGILSDEGHSTRTAKNSDEALAAIEARRPHLMFLDIWMQGSRLDGLQLLNVIKEHHPNLPVVMISGHGNIETAVSAIRAGAYDFIEKPFKEQALLDLVDGAVRASRERMAAAAAQRGIEARFARLNKREREVMERVLEGKANKVIAFELDLSMKTIEVYRASLMSKTGARSVAELAQLAGRRGEATRPD